jgi:hypothetical protein
MPKHVRSLSLWIFAFAAIATAASGCKREEAAIDGIGQYHLNKTQLKDGVVCRPIEDGLTYCSNNPQLTIAEQLAQVDLYFRGAEETAPLVEILIAVNRCKPQAIEMALNTQLGTAGTQLDNKLFWEGKAAVIVAQLPAPDGVCEINFVAPKEKERIAQLKGEAAPAGAAKPAPAADKAAADKAAADKAAAPANKKDEEGGW